MEVSDRRHHHQVEEADLLLHHQHQDLEQDSLLLLLEELELDLLLLLQLRAWANSIGIWGQCHLHHLHRVLVVHLLGKKIQHNFFCDWHLWHVSALCQTHALNVVVWLWETLYGLTILHSLSFCTL
jgi:hypothetical protein